jgi:hypothetical protein
MASGLIGASGSPVPTVPLQHFDPVAIGVGEEEEAGEERAVALEILDRPRVEAGPDQPTVLGVEVVRHESDVAVAVAEGVGLGAALVDGELDLEVGVGQRR